MKLRQDSTFKLVFVGVAGDACYNNMFRYSEAIHGSIKYKAWKSKNDAGFKPWRYPKQNSLQIASLNVLFFVFFSSSLVVIYHVAELASLRSTVMFEGTVLIKQLLCDSHKYVADCESTHRDLSHVMIVCRFQTLRVVLLYW